MPRTRITSFTGENAFLSNFYMTNVFYEGVLYPSSEHAYMAAKTTDLDLRREISKLPTPGQAKRFGRKIELRANWDKIKFKIMQEILEIKFSDPELRKKLLDTKPYDLVEGNTWGDTIWGESPIGTGQNNLGKLLMNIRDNSLADFLSETVSNKLSDAETERWKSLKLQEKNTSTRRHE